MGQDMNMLIAVEASVIPWRDIVLWYYYYYYQCNRNIMEQTPDWLSWSDMCFTIWEALK